MIENLIARKKAEKRFRFFGLLMMLTSMAFLTVLFVSIIFKGVSGFFAYEVRLELTPTQEQLDERQYRTIIFQALNKTLKTTTRNERKQARKIISRGAHQTVQNALQQLDSTQPKTIWLPLSTLAENIIEKKYDPQLPEARRIVKDNQIRFIAQLQEQERIRHSFNTAFFTNGARTTPETAGVGIAILGSFYMMLIVILTSVPLGVAAAIYLEEFAPKKNRWIRLIELNINNLAAVPSIVFGILGLAVFINTFGLPRSSPLVGGLVLSLMTLPTIIIATRSILKAVPTTIKWSAYGVGASRHQAIFHHVLPVAFPGIITGAIIGLAQALGETAPLLIIGMVAFVADYPKTIFEPTSALPVQTFIWAGSPDPAFATRTAAAIIVLLAFLLAMNATAVYLRHKYEKKH